MKDATNTLKPTDPVYPGGNDARPPKMNPERKALWVAALRSGQYEQIGDMLCCALTNEPDPGRWGYCCLGVACDVKDPKGWRIAKNRGFYEATYDNEVAALPTSVIRWLWDLPDDADIMIRSGYISPHDPYVLVSPRSGDKKRWVALSELNDSYNWDFNRIADVIEEQL